MSFEAELSEYFICAATGISGRTCERSYERLASDIPIAIGYALLGLYPIVALIYVVNVEELKQGCCGKKGTSGPHRRGVYFPSSSTSDTVLKGSTVTNDSVMNKPTSNFSSENNV